MDQVSEGHEQSTIWKRRQNAKVGSSAKLGDDKSNGGSMVNVMVHDVPDVVWDVKQTLHAGHTAGADTSSHYVDLPMKPRQLHLQPFSATKIET